MSHQSIVDANYRFMAASQKVNARIIQRQLALALCVTLMLGLLVALVALKPGDGSRQLPIEWMVLGFSGRIYLPGVPGLQGCAGHQ